MKWRYPADDYEPPDSRPVEDFRTALARQDMRRKLSVELDEWRYHPKDVDAILDRIMDIIEEHW